MIGARRAGAVAAAGWLAGGSLLLACAPLTTDQEQDLGFDAARALRKELDFVRDPWVVDYVDGLGDRLLAAAGPQPFEFRFYVVRDPELNAYALPAGYIYVNTGILLDAANVSELAGVLAHEIGHVANGDMVTLALIQGVLNTFVMFFARVVAQVVDSFLRRDDNEGLGFFGYIAVVMVAEIVFGILASMIAAWFSRFREYRADAAGAKLAGSGAMINALARLKAETQMPDQMPDTLTAFAITTGQTRKLMEKLFASPPPLDDRIRALKEAAYRQ